MKLKTYISSLILLLPFIFSCTEATEFDTQREVDIKSFTLYAIEDGNDKNQYAATIDNEAGTIKINFPYFSSNTEEISPDLSKVRLIATLPQGATMDPVLTGVIDITQPMNVTLNMMNGTKRNYEITAERVKSNRADITKLTLPDLPTVTIGYGEKDGENKIFIYRTSSAIYDALKEAKVELAISPWATSNISNGTVLNLTERNEFIITAQDGVTKKSYFTEMVEPEYVPEGEIGRISLLFGYQLTVGEPRGFEKGKNRSLAVSGSELVVGHTNGNFKRYDRFTGVELNKTVNTSGTAADKGMVHGIAADDNGILLAVTLASPNNTYIPNKTFEIYAWKNGLDKAPVKLLSKALPDAGLSFLAADGSIGRTISVKGDVINGRAQIMVTSTSQKTVVRYQVENGIITNADKPWTRTYTYDIGNNGKAIPMTDANNTDFILATGNTSRMHYWCQVEPAKAEPINPGSWWASDIKGSAYVEFNGLKLLATQNGNYSGTVDAYNRLVVGDMTTYDPSAIFGTKRVMDSRLQNFDPDFAGTQNSSITGMTSFYNANGILGANENKTGDVAFASNSDGSAVQVYMLTTDHGIIAYDISRFVPF